MADKQEKKSEKLTGAALFFETLLKILLFPFYLLFIIIMGFLKFIDRLWKRKKAGTAVILVALVLLTIAILVRMLTRA